MLSHWGIQLQYEFWWGTNHIQTVVFTIILLRSNYVVTCINNVIPFVSILVCEYITVWFYTHQFMDIYLAPTFLVIMI
jgi:hypothetical protein